ncbi:MAG: alpha-D-ribose 1-methylphosphonate 5-triphosphate diphosphatase [Pseudotabrizicola sp.]|uniref:alpha-D-ribose 1-methylphosphonate 5-triphosphate diphosphatase n=1 Tax=Pseudotabrizicola sp. TaxID=2939647 RepID=UPI00272F6E1A|nr:alpha-D-ribose 1-methylphosphonate 5-triphosphate diphosphatase [Pseudotabrizicola sp.]MDP2083394.1 alpha-D-ribose 1-methylphosphonate 5-triphosphate diphosphatase [Pseudotabrizicola sp.]MDZ7574932.1 alpha-D-ribose 1-methylphosphonate 5-triphosphate diphosphatase [Pseudotabrizicola sp.]
MTDVILENAMLVLPDGVRRGSVRMKEGVIVDISDSPSRVAGVVDCEGDLVMPGLIELHTDNLERHIEPRPKVNWPHQAAIIAHDAELASVGITTVFDALRVGSVTSNAKANYGEYARALADEILDLRSRGALRISHFLHLRAEVCSETLVSEMAKFGPEDRIGIVSLMDHTPGERQFRDVSKLRDYVCGKHGLTDEGFDDHVASQRALRDRLGALHEATAVAESRRYGATLASHDDTTTSQVAASASHGVTFAEFPTTVEAAKACVQHGIKVMMGAPNLIRGGSHSGNVAASTLAEADLLDIVSSDYVPSSLLSAALLLGDLWGDIARGVQTVTRAPALATGLTDRGQLAVGARADVLRVKRISGAAAVHGTWVMGNRVA